MGACGCEDDTSCADCCGVPNGDNSSCGGSGDGNQDGNIDVLDVVSMVDAILGIGDLGECGNNEADVNGDGSVSVLDVISVVDVILSGEGDDSDVPDCVSDCEGIDTLDEMVSSCGETEEEQMACFCEWFNGLDDCLDDCGDDPDVAEAAEACSSGGCGEGYSADCSGDGDCCPDSWIGDGFADCEDQAYGCDLTCYDNDGGDCDETADDGGTTGGSEACSDCEFDFTTMVLSVVIQLGMRMVLIVQH
jgi:hypothetical protein